MSTQHTATIFGEPFRLDYEEEFGIYYLCHERSSWIGSGRTPWEALHTLLAEVIPLQCEHSGCVARGEIGTEGFQQMTAFLEWLCPAPSNPSPQS